MPKYFLGLAETEAAYAETGEAEFAEVMAAHRSFTAAVDGGRLHRRGR